MALAAVVFLPETGSAGLRFAGLAFPVFLARQAAHAGCRHIILYAHGVGRAELAMVETLKAEGLSVNIVRNLAELAASFHPDERVAVFAPDRIVSPRLIEGFLKETGSLLGVSPRSHCDADFRIDAERGWSGFAVLPASVVRLASELPGDWAGELALLRIALQQGATQQEIQPEDVRIVTNENDLAAFLETDAHWAFDGANIVTARWSRVVSAPLIIRNLAPFHIALACFGVTLIALTSGWYHSPITGLFAVLPAMVLAQILNQISEIRLDRARWPRDAFSVIEIVASLLLLILSYRAMTVSGQWGHIALSVWLIVYLATLQRQRTPTLSVVVISAVAAMSLFVPSSFALGATLAGVFAWQSLKGRFGNI